ncbi:unnamed protein product [Amoebophrya sp. A120]|nr:unnamed protein product [Amoebophrya sp. A120]|eukprot:GSA120T00023391001.1
MGNGLSSGSKGGGGGAGVNVNRTTLDAAIDAEFVPTRVEVGRCASELKSQWWTSNPPLSQSLKAYGKPYGRLFAKTCGQYRQDFRRCMEKNKFDLFNLAQWYPVCGEFSELENACGSQLIREIDRKCLTQLNRAAKKLPDNLSDDDYKEVGRCVQSLLGSVSFGPAEQQAAKTTFEAKKAPFTYNFAAGGMSGPSGMNSGSAR